MSHELDYGNARVRALKGRLLSSARLERLARSDATELAALLADEGYRSDLEQASRLASPRQHLHAAVSLHLARALRPVPRWYEGGIQDNLALLMRRWDVRNLVTLLRGQARRASPDEMMPLVVPAGRLDEVALGEIARQPGLRAALELLVSWKLPSRHEAMRLLEQWPSYDVAGDLRVLEHRVHWLFAEAVSQAAEQGVLQPAVAEPLRASIDRSNITTALRLWEARMAATDREVEVFASLPGGTLDADQLAHAVSREAPIDVVASMLERRSGHWARAALERWVVDRDLRALERRLLHAITRRALRGFVDADPLSIAVPVAFVYAAENQANNLHLVVEAAAGTIAVDGVHECWLLPEI